MTFNDGTASEYNGRYCSGFGDVGYLRLIDQSFEYFHPNPYRQNISMLYLGTEERLCENPNWYSWWIQNSYGPTFCALPFLQEPWITALQNAQELWFKFQGDGKQIGAIQPDPAPVGALCDCAGPNGVIYKQGDMCAGPTNVRYTRGQPGDQDWKLHDWFFEATAAGVLLQAELLLIDHKKEVVEEYLPKLDLACTFIETRRDPENNLFLVGPASNLLAPSYGGVREADGSFGKGYLAGLSITYLAALDRMVELYRLVNDKEKLAAYRERQKITRRSLSLLLTREGYFVKSIEVNGTKHGVYGQEKYGYFEVAPNVDAVCHRAASDAVSNSIMRIIHSISELRPNGMLITNYPSLDDTYSHWGDTEAMEKDHLLKFGRWVNGAVWTTMEARAIMAYYRMGMYNDILSSARAMLNFAQDFKLDAPLPDFGKSVWFKDKATNFCYDSLGVPAAVVRGLFEYVFKADRLILYPHIPSSITEYFQKELIRFGDKRLTIRVQNRGSRIVSLKVNGEEVHVTARDHVALKYSSLPISAHIDLATDGGWPRKVYIGDTNLVMEDPRPAALTKELPPELAGPRKHLSTMLDRIAEAAGLEYARIFLREAIAAFDAYRERAAMYEAGFYPEINADKHTAIMACYHYAATQMYAGIEAMMKSYIEGSDQRLRQFASMFEEAKMN